MSRKSSPSGESAQGPRKGAGAAAATAAGAAALAGGVGASASRARLSVEGGAEDEEAEEDDEVDGDAELDELDEEEGVGVARRRACSRRASSVAAETGGGGGASPFFAIKRIKSSSTRIARALATERKGGVLLRTQAAVAVDGARKTPRVIHSGKCLRWTSERLPPARDGL